MKAMQMLPAPLTHASLLLWTQNSLCCWWTGKQHYTSHVLFSSSAGISLFEKKLCISKRRTASPVCFKWLKTSIISHNRMTYEESFYFINTTGHLANILAPSNLIIAKLFVEWKVDWIYADSTVSESMENILE